ncbi:astacin [Oesophagostomum dentatum]|uniref:Metalloendopeptidase n=1 Tax=Oesophagostomum dentatum TaxID=61180 RepID=A0A0B1T6S1_OESDE|nr:astacin [Oesophagostomum dentatum]
MKGRWVGSGKRKRKVGGLLGLRMDARLIMHLLLLLLSASNIAFGSRGKVIDIFDPKQGADIVELRFKRGALQQRTATKWNIHEDGNVYIPYTYAAESGYTDEERKNVTQVMKRIEENTCIKFVVRKNESDYVEIRNAKHQTCYTNIGRVGGRQILQLEASDVGTCMTQNIVMHELMHIIGLYHEETRHDRDTYVKIHYENVDEWHWSNFHKAVEYQLPYDYYSITHSRSTAYSKNGKNTITTHDPSFQHVIGKQQDASPMDYHKICSIYSCRKCMY